MNSTAANQMRAEAAIIANRDDADLWRWFCLMYGDGRLRWYASGLHWFVCVDHKHLATEADFDAAIRSARHRFESGHRHSRKVRPGSGNAPNVTLSIGLGRVKPRAS
jgi:hypothetical protein